MKTKQEKCIELLGLNEHFTLEELKKAYFKKANIVHPDKHPDREVEHWNQKMVEVNDAYETLRNELSPNKHTDKTSVFTTECCRKLGLLLEDAKTIYKKSVMYGYKLDFDSWLKNRLSNLKKYEINQSKIMQICNQSVMLKDITFQNIVNIYECDCEFGGCDIEFSEWFTNLINTCKEMENKLLKKNYLIIEDEIRDYIHNKLKRDFIEILKEKQEIREMCQEMGLEVYVAEFQHDFDSDWRSSFKEYLQKELAVFRVYKEMGMTKQQADEYYRMYLADGYAGTQLEFLEEARAALPFCRILGKGYFSLKKEYNRLPAEERPDSFIFWAELKATASLFQKNSAQILERIYINSKEAGYARSLKDLLMSLGGKHLDVVTNDDEMSKEEEPPEEVDHVRKV